MESVHELAALPADSAGANLVLVQAQDEINHRSLPVLQGAESSSRPSRNEIQDVSGLQVWARGLPYPVPQLLAGALHDG